MATSYDCKFIETSVGINHNVDELLVGILTQIRLKLDNPPDPSIPRDQYYAKKRSRSPLGNCAPRLYRGSRTSASLRVRKILSKVWSINSKSKSCENLHVLQYVESEKKYLVCAYDGHNLTMFPKLPTYWTNITSLRSKI